MRSYLTVFRTQGHRRATKRHVRNLTLKDWITSDYDAGHQFNVEEHPIAGLGDLARLIESRRKDTRSFIVAGALTPEARAVIAADPNALLPRRMNPKKGKLTTILDVPRRWLVIDIDKYPMPDWGDLIDDPEHVIDFAIRELLPEPFHDAESFWQLTASAGIRPGVLRVHLFFWLAKLFANAWLRDYLRLAARGVDPSVINAAQAIYIADPIIEGAHDPIPRRMGWRKGLNAEVVLPELNASQLQRATKNQRERVLAAVGLSASAARTVDGALALLGDGEGLGGFHEVLRTAIYLYVSRVPPAERDDAALKAKCRAAILAAPRGAARDPGSIDRYTSDAYLDDSIAGALAWKAAHLHLLPESVPAHYEAPALSVDQGREILATELTGLVERVIDWHSRDKRFPLPECAAFEVDLGVGKSVKVRLAIPQLIERLKAAGLPYRVVYLVPRHRLGVEVLQHLLKLGVSAAVWRGRERDDPDNPGVKMCLDTEAVKVAREAGANIEGAVCGSGKAGEPICTHFHQCAYQRQKQAVREADVVIAAHPVIFAKELEAIAKNVGLVVIDEAFWQSGLELDRVLTLETITPDPARCKVFRKNEYGREVLDEVATNDLHTLRGKLAAALATMPDAYVQLAPLIAAGLTEDDCCLASELEARRRVPVPMQPGMSLADRTAAAKQAAVNAQVTLLKAVWGELQWQLHYERNTASGRLELETEETHEGSRRVIRLHTHKWVSRWVQDVPVVLLDATFPESIAREFLPMAYALSEVRVQAPHMRVRHVVGGFGKSTLVSGATEAIPLGKRLLALRTFVSLRSQGQPALVITYEHLEPVFHGLPHVDVAHFNDIAGSDKWGHVRHLFIVGRPLPRSEVVCKMAAAVTGRPVPHAEPVLQTRGLLMRNGPPRAVQVRAYEDPDMEAVRTAITDAEVMQGIGRARGVNRTAGNPVDVWVMADVVARLVVDSVEHWDDLEPTRVDAMLDRGVLLESPTDAAKVYPDLFETRDAAKHALKEAGYPISGRIPYESIIGKPPTNAPSLVTYRPHGRGQQTRRAWINSWPPPRFYQGLATLERELGPFAEFRVEPLVLPPEMVWTPPTQEVASEAEEESQAA